jgi:SdrD B-like domain/CARDB
VEFAIPGAGPFKIVLLNGPLNLFQPVTIDGFSQAGATANTLAAPGGLDAHPLIIVSGEGGGAARAMDLLGGNAVVRGLVFQAFDAASSLWIRSGGNRIEGCFFGVEADGSAAISGTAASNTAGIELSDAMPGQTLAGNEIGGILPAQRNLLSGLFNAISLSEASSTLIRGNLIGTDLTGASPIRNRWDGILVSGFSGGASNVIGGASPAAANVISGNDQSGVVVTVGSGTRVEGNRIGTSASGLLPIGNTVDGVDAWVPAVIGSNIIGASGSAGIRLRSGSTGSTVIGNFLGTDATGNADVGNNIGILVDDDANTLTIGGSGAGNVIANSDFSGISVSSSAGSGITISQNSIYGNGKFNGRVGLNLGSAGELAGGVSPNDPLDADAGPNGLQNFPVVTSVSASAGVTTISGTLESTPSAAFSIEFFNNVAAHPTGYGEGKVFVGSTNVQTDASGQASFEFPYSGSAQWITATATASGSTSEFSLARQAAQRAVSVSGFKIEDTNGNGVRDSGEPGVPGWPITVTGTDSEGNTVSQSTTTGADGSYVISGLTEGLYSVGEGSLVGWTASGATTSDVSNLTDGATLTFDFLNYRAASFSGRVFDDTDRNGQPDTGEAGLVGWTVTLNGTDGAGNAVSTSQTTDAQGAYAFAGLTPGTYSARLSLEPRYSQTAPNNPVDITRTLRSGESSPDNLFGARLKEEAIAVVATKYEDRNANGVRDPDDSGVPDWPISIEGTQDDGTAISLDVTTGADGTVSIGTLTSGVFTVSEGARPEWTAATPASTSPTAVGGGGLLSASFGNYRNASVSGRVFEDLNANGAADPEDSDGLLGITVTLTGTTGRGDSVNLSTVTDASGVYRFDGLVPGSYEVRHEPSQPTRARASAPAGGQYMIQLVSGQRLSGQDFGDYYPAELLVCAYRDDNGDGTQDAGEPNFGGLIVQLAGTDALGQSVAADQSTDTAGQTRFADLLPGSYVLSQDTPSGLTQTEPGPPGTHSLSVTSDLGGIAGEDCFFFGNRPRGFVRLETTTSVGDVREQIPVSVRLVDHQNLALPAPNGGLRVELAGQNPLSGLPILVQANQSVASGTVDSPDAGDLLLRLVPPPGWIPLNSTTLRIGPDLLVGAVETSPVDGSTGPRTTLRYSVEAAADRVDASGFEIGIYATDLRTGVRERVGRRSIAGLTAGTSVSGSLDVVLPSTQTQIEVRADDRSALPELSESNNTWTTDVRFRILRDVAATSDGILDPDVIGRFISGFAGTDNTFQAFFEPNWDVRSAEFRFGDRLIESTDRADGSIQTTLDMGSLPGNDVILSVTVLLADGLRSDPLTRVIRMVSLPTWLDENTLALVLGPGKLLGDMTSDAIKAKLLLEISPPAGAPNEGGPFAYQTSAGGALKKFIPMDQVGISTTVSAAIEIPLDDTQGGKLTLLMGKTQRVGTKKVGTRTQGFAVRLQPGSLAWDKLTLIAADGQQLLLGASKTGLFLPPLLGVINSWTFSLDLFAKLRAQLVLGSGPEGLFADDNGEVSRIEPGLRFRVSLEAATDLGVAKVGVRVRPAIDGSIVASYTSADGASLSTTGSFSATLSAFASLFGGRYRGTIGTKVLGPFPLWGSAGKGPQVAAASPAESPELPIPDILPRPAIDGTGSGQTIAVWISDPGSGSAPILNAAIRTPGSDVFSDPTVVASSGAYRTDPQVAVSGAQDAIAVWTENALPLGAQPDTLADVLAAQDIYMASWDGSAWSPPQPVMADEASSGRADGLPVALIDPTGAAGLLAWVRGTRPDALDQSAYEVFSAPWLPTGPGQPAAITSNGVIDLALTGDFVDPATAIAVWMQDDDGDFSTPSDWHLQWARWGGTWGTPQRLSSVSERLRSPSFRSTGSGTGALAWVQVEVDSSGIETYRLLERSFDGTTWGAERSIDVSPYQIADPAVSYDGGSTVSVTWRGYTDGHINGDLKVAFRETDGSSWTSPRALTQDNDVEIDPVAAIDGLGNLLVLSLKITPDSTGSGPAGKANFFGGLHLVSTRTSAAGPIGEDLSVNGYAVEPDLAVPASEVRFSPATFLSGDAVRASLIVRNIGARTAPSTTVRVHLSGQGAASDQPLQSLAPDSAAAVTVDFVATGRDTLHVLADPLGVVTEQDRSNNRMVMPVTLMPDWSVDALARANSTPARPGEPTALISRVRNRGRVASPLGGLSLRQGLTADFSDSVPVESVAIPVLNPGDSVEVELSFTPANAGRVYLFSSVNADSTLPEASLLNNLQTLEIGILPDLVISRMSRLDARTFDVALANLGGVPSPPSTTVLFAGSPLSGGIPVDSLRSGAIAPGDSVLFTLSMGARTRASSAVIWSDASDQIPELSESNNRATEAYFPIGIPDLRAGLSLVYGRPAATPVVVSVENVGTWSSPPVEYRLDRISAGADSVLARAVFDSVNPGETRSDTLVVVLPAGVTPALRLTLDPTDQIRELSEVNNSAEVFNISTETEDTELPDAFFVDPAFPNPASMSTVRFGLPEPSRVDFEVFNILGQRVTHWTRPALGAGTGTFVWPVASTASGVYLIRVRALGFSGTAFTHSQSVVLLR